MRRRATSTVPTRTDLCAVLRARLSTAYHAIRCARAAIIVQEYAAKLASLSLCLPAGQLAAAAAALSQEREAALLTMHLEVRDMERRHFANIRQHLPSPRRPGKPDKKATRLLQESLRRPVTGPAFAPVRPPSRLKLRILAPRPQRG